VLSDVLPQAGRHMVARQCGLHVVTERLEPLQLVDVFRSCCPRGSFLDRQIELDEALGKLTPFVHGPVFPAPVPIVTKVHSTEGRPARRFGLAVRGKAVCPASEQRTRDTRRKVK
jgi:hypothetical protein